MFLPTIIRYFPKSALLALTSLTLAAACGKYDPGDFGDGGAEDAGEAGRGGRGGTGGRAPTAGGAAPGPTVRCGSATCPAPVNLLAALPIPTGLPAPVACCVDESSGQCGSAASQGAKCEPPAQADSSCPGIDLGALGAIGGMGMMTPAEPMSGCCTADGKCGLDGALFGRGCVENGEARMLLSSIPFVGGLFDVPPEQACAEADDAGVVEDDAGR